MKRLAANWAEAGSFFLFGISLFLLYHSEAPWITEISLKFFRLINLHAIHTHSFRELILLLQLPAYLALPFTQDVQILKSLYMLPCLFIPFVSLFLSWLFLREEDRFLIVWPTLGILLGSFQGQHQVDSEHMMVMQLTWPYLIALRGKLVQGPWILFSSLLLFFLHPIALVSLALAAVVVWQQERMWAVVLIALSILRLFLIRFHHYDLWVIDHYLYTEQGNLFVGLWTFSKNNLHLPLVNIIVLWSLGASLWFNKRERPWWNLFALLLFALSFLVPLYYGPDPSEAWAIYFRLNVFLVVPLFVGFLWRLQQGKSRAKMPTTLLGMSFCYFLCMFCMTQRWQQMERQIHEELVLNQHLPCIAVEDLKAVPAAFKRYYPLTYYYLFSEGPRPKFLLTFRENCRLVSLVRNLDFLDPYVGVNNQSIPLKGFYFDFTDILANEKISSVFK